jgi:glycosyltransferase involved in cell wall biosynthesis
MARLAADKVEFELVLVGDGELRGELEARITQLGLSDRISITGWADSRAVRAHIEAGRVFVLPSFAEGLPVALMEALAIGRPVVTTNVAGIAELVTNECGWLIPAGSVDALHEALREALRAPLSQLEQMSAVGRERVRERHVAYEQAGVLANLFQRV